MTKCFHVNKEYAYVDGKGNIQRNQMCKACYVDWVVQLEIAVKKKLKKDPNYWREPVKEKVNLNYLPSTIKRKMI